MTAYGNETHLGADGWRKVPSVTAGGRAFFWFRRDPVTAARQWLIWDRVARTWTFEEDRVLT